MPQQLTLLLIEVLRRALTIYQTLHHHTTLSYGLPEQQNPVINYLRIMLASSKCLFNLVLLLLMAGGSSSAVQTYPTTVELDLVFPRNETYAPVGLFPIIFALQNPQVAVPLDLNIAFKLGRVVGDQGAEGSANYSVLEQDNVNFSKANLSTNDPSFILRYSEKVNNTEGQFWVSWGVDNNNCSLSANGDPATSLSSNYRITYYTTAKDAQQPSLVTKPDICPLIQSVTYNVTEALQLRQSQDTCAVTAEPSPPATPCALSINDTQESSIMASITSTACAWAESPFPTLAICSSKASIAARQDVGSLWLIGLACLVAFSRRF